MSAHEAFLNHVFHGVSWVSGFGMFVTLGIALSCICRLNASKPTLLFTSEQALYLALSFWAVETFCDLFFWQIYSGHDIAFGSWALLYLHSSYKDWVGRDCVSDGLNYFRKDHRRRIQEVRAGIKFGRRARDKA